MKKIEKVISALASFPFLILTMSIHGAENNSRSGADIFSSECAACHEATENARAPSLQQLRGLSPAAVVTTLTTGKMSVQGSNLLRDEQLAVAEYMTGLSISANPIASENDNFCSAMPSLAESFNQPGWNGWGGSATNNRSQSAVAAGLAVEDISSLELAWAFGFPDALAARTQPSVIGEWLFTGGDNGAVYALNALSGCTVWRFKADAAVRTAMKIVSSMDANGQNIQILLFGDGQANAYALNAETGTLIWQQKIDDHPNAGITGSPAVHDGSVFFPVSAAGEEVRGPNADYGCCTFRGSVSALDISSGEQIWKTWTIAQAPLSRGRSENGNELFGPAGAGIWGSPTIDSQRGLLYVGTGNGYADPPQPGTDSIMAMSLENGEVRWIQQTLSNDNWLWQCESAENQNNPNCPEVQGPDFDFSVAPLLATLSDGSQLLVAPQKSGLLHALDPDAEGAIVWQFRIGTGTALGAQWGAASDENHVYVGRADTTAASPGGLFAIELKSGNESWFSPPQPSLCNQAEEPLCFTSYGGPPSLIPGAVFSGGSDGGLRAFSTDSGDLLWQYDTNRDFETVNGVTARGATIDAAGPIVVNGMVFVNSGYNGIVGRAGNVLLAFKLP